MNQLGSDPAPNEKSVPCKECGRPTALIGTKLCDACYNANRSHQTEGVSREDAQQLFEDWLKAHTRLYWEIPLPEDTLAEVLTKAKKRAQKLGLEWRHEDELAEQIEMAR